MEDPFGKQIEGLDEVGILEAIKKATNLNEMNTLRKNCVRFLKTPRGKEILLSWQKKYWSLKNCPACGHSL